MAIGKKTGGRCKGTPNRRTAEMRAAMAATGELPLDYMLRVMRDEAAEPARRDAMAVAAAAYLHPRLAAVAHRHTEADASLVRPVLNLYYNKIPHPLAAEPLGEAGVSYRPLRVVAGRD